MPLFLLIVSLVIFACIIFNKISTRLGVPMLLAFIVLGMIFGTDGLLKIPFDDYVFAEKICTVALIFIMFYGGFGTKISEAKPVVLKSVLLSSLGTILTAFFVGIFCCFVLKISFLESFLIGSVISSTDAASVFSVLRSKRLNLKYNTASLLEVESGSNDPFSYMLTAVILSVMEGKVSGVGVSYMIFAQIAYGAVSGLLVAYLAVLFLKKIKFCTPGFDMIFIVSVAVFSYALPSYFGGNGYLSAYITGIILGNIKMHNKKALANFFDGVTGLMQMLLFFLLGLLSFPSQFANIIVPAISIALFLTFIARPLAVFLILSPFKCHINQQLFVSWSGLRGAASIVFAIMTVINRVVMHNDIFHMVFFIVLFSILVQGTLIPFFAKKLDMTDKNADVMKTFTDYIDEVPIQFIQFVISNGHEWTGKMIKEIHLPPDSLFVLLIRNGKKIVPAGSLTLNSGDKIIMSGLATESDDGVHLYEKIITEDDEMADKKISEIKYGEKLIIMIKRDKKIIIPKGTTVLKAGDILVINDKDAH